MTIEEAKKEREALEQSIRRQLLEFSEKTGLDIDRVDVSFVDMNYLHGFGRRRLVSDVVIKATA
jgi:hypothetical protein